MIIRKLVGLIILVGLVVGFAGTAEAGWYDASWGYRRAITLSPATSQADYQVKVTLTTAIMGNPYTHVNADGSDILFTGSDGTTLQDYWIESWDNTGTSTIWVEVKTSGESTIYMYYGKASASSASNGANTFVFFDDFLGTSLNTGKWDSSGTIAVSNSEVSLDQNDSILSITSFAIDTYSVRAECTADEQDIEFIRWADSLSTPATNQVWIYNSDADCPDDFDKLQWKFKDTYSSSWGSADKLNWQNNWRTYEIPYRALRKFYQNDDLINSGYFYSSQPSSNLKVGAVVWNSSQESTLKIDWILVRKCISAYLSNEPSASVGSEETPAPTITISEATLVEETTARLNGNVTGVGSGENPTVTVYWGTSDGGQTPGNWTNSSAPTSPDQPQGVAAFYKDATDLSPGTLYYFSARAMNSGGTDWPDASLSFTTKPEAPTGLTATAQSSTQIDVSWTKGTGAEKTMVRRKVDSYPSSVSDGDEAYFDTGSSFNDTGLTGGAHYYYRAWSYTTGAPDSGYSDNYASADAITNQGPTAPTSLLCEGETNPTGVTDTTPEFSAIYNDPDSGDTSNAYEIQVGTTSDPINSPDMWDSGWLADSTSDEERCSDKSYAGSALSWGTKYYWAIRFRDDDNTEGAWSSVANFTLLSAGGLILSAGVHNPSAETILNNAQNEEMVQIKLTAGSSEGVNISSITFTSSGTGDEANDITTGSVKLYNDVNTNGVFDSGTDTQIGSAQSWSGDNGTVSFSGLSESISQSSSENWLLICSFAGGIADGKTYKVSLANNSDITAVGATTGNSITPTGAPVEGGVKTIGAVSGAPTITIPENGKTVGTVITVLGTATASSTVMIKDKDGNTVGTTTADTSGNYRLSLSELSTGSNKLTPYVGETAGSSHSVNIVSSPTTDQVPTITSPSDGANINKVEAIVSGKGLANQSVEVKALDSSGNLITAGSGTVDSEGNYEVTLTASLPSGDNWLNVNVNGVASAIIKVTLVDPEGVVFDSVTNNPIQGAEVSLYKSDGSLAEAGKEIASSDANPQTTGADGKYSFSVTNGRYYLRVTALGYTFPSERTSFPSGRNVGTGSKGEEFSIAGEALELDIPLDAAPTLLKIEKEANKKEVQIGSVVTYTVKLKNETATSVINVYLEDKIPAGFKYLSGKTILDGKAIFNPIGRRSLTFNIGTVEGNSERTLKYQLVVGSGVTFGKYENTAFAKYWKGTRLSNFAQEEVKVTPTALFDLGTVIGKVFWDWNGNGVQDKVRCPMSDGGRQKEKDGERSEEFIESMQRDSSKNQQFNQRTKKIASDIGHPASNRPETGIPHIRIVTEEGTIITTDGEGKFHLAGLTPGRHLFRLDETTLPEGAYLTTPKVVIVNFTPGILAKVNFGVKRD